jgi:hypothetical protein
VIAAGNRPYRSNGQHRNAGDFHLAGGILAGHDHNRQWLDADTY